MLGSWVNTALELATAGQLQTQYKPSPDDNTPPEAIGRGYEFTREVKTQIDGRDVNWVERVLIVQSFAHQDSQNTKLQRKLDQAERDLSQLTLSGKGRRVWRQELALRGAIEAIEKQYGVEGLLTVELSGMKV